MDHENTMNNADTAKLSNDDVISTLNGLIETCKDGQDGFKQSAEAVKNADLKTKFYELSQQRSQYVGELQNLVRELGGDPEKEGSFSGAIHRGWINIKGVITGNDDEAILNEAERGENYAKDAYNTALEQNLPSNVNEVISRQLREVTQAHDSVKALRNYAHEAAKTVNS
jgi:uncharacterized protein (TIGR02284 family)